VAVLDGDELVLRLGLPGGRLSGPPAAPAHPPPLPPPGGEPPRPPVAPAQPTYLVQPGDTLSEIAATQLGSASLADELARLNGIEDPTSLRAGQVLRLR
jgi:nucleoid-associated protein YgaU